LERTVIFLPWHAAQREALERRLADGRMAHGLLLAGLPGLGKGGFARAFAQRLHCRLPEAAPCGICPGCAQFATGGHPDHRSVALEINEETGKPKQSIGVDQIRELSAALALTAQHGGWKTAIIEPADAMHVAAANALLKTLEEPPPRTLLMLVSARPARLPATVRSRCQRLEFAVPDPATALGWLHGRAPRDDWELWLDLAGGAPLAADALVSGGFAARRGVAAAAIFDLAAGRAEPTAVAAAWAADDPRTALRWLATVVMDLIHLAQAGADAKLRNADLRARLQTLGQRLHLRPLHRFLDAVQRAHALLDSSVNPQLMIDALLIAWAAGLEPGALRPLLQDD
jgi:DNA polymerase-3 subunit delta'